MLHLALREKAGLPAALLDFPNPLRRPARHPNTHLLSPHHPCHCLLHKPGFIIAQLRAVIRRVQFFNAELDLLLEKLAQVLLPFGRIVSKI